MLEAKASASGFVHAIEAEQLGLAAMLLGAGRATKDAAIDYAVGVTLRKKVGDAVQAGDTLALLHIRRMGAEAEAIAAKVEAAYSIEQAPPELRPLLLSVVTAEGIRRLS